MRFTEALEQENIKSGIHFIEEGLEYVWLRQEGDTQDLPVDYSEQLSEIAVWTAKEFLTDTIVKFVCDMTVGVIEAGPFTEQEDIDDYFSDREIYIFEEDEETAEEDSEIEDIDDISSDELDEGLMDYISSLGNVLGNQAKTIGNKLKSTVSTINTNAKQLASDRQNKQIDNSKKLLQQVQDKAKQLSGKEDSSRLDSNKLLVIDVGNDNASAMKQYLDTIKLRNKQPATGVFIIKPRDLETMQQHYYPSRDEEDKTSEQKIQTESFSEMSTLADELNEYLRKNNFYHYVYANYDDSMNITISNGDWKHDHARFKLLLDKFMKSHNLNYDIERVDEEESDSDTFTAEYMINVEKNNLTEIFNSNSSAKLEEDTAKHFEFTFALNGQTQTKVIQAGNMQEAEKQLRDEHKNEAISIVSKKEVLDNPITSDDVTVE